MTALQITPSQTAGPYLAIGLSREPQNRLVDEDGEGAVWIRGTLFDGAGEPIPDGLVEIWQADAGGLHRPDWGFGRCGTHDTEGGFEFLTVKPGRVSYDFGRTQAPHLVVHIYARGLLRALQTRMYFPDEREANGADPILNGVAPTLREAMIARDAGDHLHWDIHVQGPHQPAFFALENCP